MQPACRAKRIAILGGGSAGITAAISAARSGGRASIFEHGERLGRKLLSTGNGKCNFTNRNLSPDFYNPASRALVEKILTRFGHEQLISFMKELGVLPRYRGDNVYPYPNTASAVLDVLLLELSALDVEVNLRCGSPRIKRQNNPDSGRSIFSIDGRKFDSLIICCGGMAAPKSGSDGSGYEYARRFGHSVIEPLPALTALKSQEKYFPSLAGIRCDAALTLMIDGRKRAESSGELQLLKDGLSGICVFDLSSQAVRSINEGRNVSIVIDFLPSASPGETEEFLLSRIRSRPGRDASELLTGLFHKRLRELFFKKAGIRRQIKSGGLSPAEIRALSEIIRGLKVPISGYGGFEHCQVTSGGVPTDEVGCDLQSTLCKGLYFAGEILDADGRCGGYNLQWAFSSGYIAGQEAAGTSGSFFNNLN